MLLEISSVIAVSLFWLGPGLCVPRSNLITTNSFQNYRKATENLDAADGILKFRGNSSEDVYSSTETFRNDTGLKSQSVVFPDSKTDDSRLVPQFDVDPECAQGSTFCEDFSGYPHARVKHVLNLTNRYREMFGIDEGPIEHRIGDPEDNFICPSIDRIIFPKIAKNKYNKWKFIINQGEQEGYVQGVRIETCIKANSPCSFFENTPNGYVTSCKQKYIYRRLLSISDIGRPVPDTFHMPSACCCSYKRDHGYLINFGKDAPPIEP